MHSFLPDEILKEILSPALQIPDKSFVSVHVPSPFAKYKKSTSAYLLVSKDWLRVATPLLYNVVILRSKAQIQALAWALKSTPELGHFIKKIRIEGSYNSSLLRVFQAANNLTDLCLSLEIYAQDNVSGICKGLSLIQPHRVIIYDPTQQSRSFNKKTVEVVETITELIPTWTSLTSFIIPLWRDKERPLNHRLKHALCDSPSLQEIDGLPEDCSLIPNFAKIPTIRRILVPRLVLRKPIEGFRLSNVPDIVKDHPELAGLVTFKDYTVEEGTSWRARSSVVLLPAGLPRDWFEKCPTSVLENILLYAKGILDIQGTDWEYDNNSWVYEFPWVHHQGLPLVCKEFHEIIRRLDRQYIVIPSKGSLSRLAQDYRAHPELGDLAQCIWIHSCYEESLDEAQELEFIISCCPNLRTVGYIHSIWNFFTQYSFSCGAISALMTHCGHNLLDLQINLHEHNAVLDPMVLLGFTNLRNLCWSSCAILNLGHANLPKNALCNLETLSCAAGNSTFLRLMAWLNLPRIRSACFPDSSQNRGVSQFLKKHGPKLQRLQTTLPLDINVFETCPNLKILSVPEDSLDPEHFDMPSPIHSIISCSWNHPLEEIYLKTATEHMDAKGLFQFLGDLDLSSFPCLRHIKIPECGSWPITEHEIRKSYWVTWAERLKALYGVDILNSYGKAWVPRLKVKGKRR